MYEIKEMYGSIYCADESSGEILYEITEPAVLFSATPTPVVLKLGNKDKLESIYSKRLSDARAAGCEDLVADYVLADLPKDVDVLNRVYNNSGYLNVLFREHIEKLNFERGGGVADG